MHRLIPFILFICVFLVSVIVSSSIGPSWDEPDNIFAAGVYTRFFRQGFDPQVFSVRNDQLASDYGDRIYTQNTDWERYPALPLLIGGGAIELAQNIYGTLTAVQIITMFHVASGLFLSLTAVSVYLLCLRFGLPQTIALFAAIVAVSMPTVFGHGLSTIKDSAQVALFVSTLYLLSSFTMTKKRIYLVLAGICWGLSLSTKFNAVYVPIIWGIWETTSHIFSLIQKKQIKQKLLRYILEIVAAGFVFAGIGFVAMVISWPYLWFQPLTRIQEVVSYFTTVGTGYLVAWNGDRYPVGSGIPIWWYPLGSFLLSTPVIVLLLFGYGIVSTFLFKIIKKGKSVKFMTLLLLWMIIPLVRIVSGTAAFYDGIRHFMEILPAVSIIAALGLWQVIATLSMIPSLSRIHTVFRFGLPILIILYLSFMNIRLFPFSSGYIHSFVPFANTHFDRDYSGLAIREGMNYVQNHYQSATVWAPIAGHLSWYYMRPGKDIFVYGPEQADTVVFINKMSHAPKKDLDAILGSSFQMVHEISRGNDIFGWVYRRVN